MMQEVQFIEDELDSVSLDGDVDPNPLQSNAVEIQEYPLENGKPSSSYSSPSRSMSRGSSLIEPPSYADVVFTPYNGRTVNRETELGGLEKVTTFLMVTVSAPQKVLGSKGGGYVTYLINTLTDIPEFQGTSFSVRRRFRDVVTLADKLGEAYRGYFVPTRPEKNLQVIQGHEFLEHRREDLERYFTRLAVHPLLRKCSEVREFLTPAVHTQEVAGDETSVIVEAAEANGNGAVVAPEVVAPEPARGNVFRAFAELRQYVSDWGGAKPLVVEDDKEFLEQKEKIKYFGNELMRTSDRAETLVKAQDEMGKAMGNLGISLSKLGDPAAIHAANGAAKASRCYTDVNIQCMKHLDTLHEYLALMQAIHGAFNERSKALLHVQTLKSEIASLQERHENLATASQRFFGADKRKVDDCKTAIANSEAACEAAQAEYVRIKERNREEIQRYEVNRKGDMFDMLKGFVEAQVGYAEKLGTNWSEALSKMDG